MRVIVIGAGISGMTFFKLAEEQLQDVDIVCYEKNADIGGTVSCRSISYWGYGLVLLCWSAISSTASDHLP